LTYRAVADRENFANAVGETITKTRRGLKAPVTTPLTPSTNTNLDNGLTPSGWTIEQYTLGIDMYGDTMDLNMVTTRVGIASQFLQNAQVNGIQAMQSLDRIARNKLFGAYLSGNTRVRTTLGAPATTVSVDDVRGFQYVPVNGVMVPVSGSNPLTVVFNNGNTYSLTGVAVDGSNVSTAPLGVSGTLTFSANVSVADGTALNSVVAANGASVLRPNARLSTAQIVAGDLLTMQDLLAGVTILRNNRVPTIGGLYNFYADNAQLKGLFKDPDFKLLYQGQYGSKEYQTGQVMELMGLRIIPTTEAPQQTLSGVNVHRGLMCGQGALIEGDYEAIAHSDIGADDESLIEMIDGVAMVTREPLDRLKQIIAQSWYWIGGFAVPTDVTANQTIIPTATNSAYKRAVVIESA
jgi:hypothetical protein